MPQSRKRREDGDSSERKYSLAGSRGGGRGGSGGSGIPAGSRGGGGGGSGSGIPAGSRGGGGARGGGGIPAGSKPSGGRGSGSGIPAGSSVRGKRKGGSGVPAGSKDADQQSIEQKSDNGVTVSVDEDGDLDTVVAIVSATGVKDSVGDIIEPGAYEKTLRTRDAQPVWSHSWSEMIGATKEIRELPPGDPMLAGQTLSDGSPWPAHSGGLLIKMVANRQTDVGERAYQNIKFANEHRKGGMPWSIGYKATKTSKDKDGTRRIKELELYEYSPVLHGANANTKTLSVKSLDEAMDALHAGGYDTSELELAEKAEPVQPDELTASELKELFAAADLLDAIFADLGVKRVIGDPDLDEPDERWVDSDADDSDVDVLPTLVQRLAGLLEEDDFPELFDLADAFDAAMAAFDEGAAEDASLAFIEQLEADEAAFPDGSDDEVTWGDLRDVVGDALDDAQVVFYGEVIDPDDDGWDTDDEDADEGPEGDSDGFEDETLAGSGGEAEPAADTADAGGEKSQGRGETKSGRLPDLWTESTTERVMAAIDFGSGF